VSADPVLPTDLAAQEPAPSPAPVPPVRAVSPLARPLAEPPGPTPWATGLTIAAFVAVFLTMADVALCQAFAEAFGLLWIPANLLVGVGLAPSLWLLRRTPLWRWPALGAAAGLVVSWVVLLLAMLGPPPG
jgi:hypothetical protein